MSDRGKLVLIPSFLCETDKRQVFPDYNTEVIRSIRYFVVENLRSARRFLKQIDKSIVIDDLHFEVLDKHNPHQDMSAFLKPIDNGYDVGVISEAGCPAIADPGAELTLMAHKKGVRVIPLVGPSSILMAQMASGLNGQNFAFNGYLPVKSPEAINALQKFEKRSKQDRQSQIFIEAPYRNMQLLDLMMKTLSAQTKICIASDITGENEQIQTRTVKEWKGQLPAIHKVPCIFILMA